MGALSKIRHNLGNAFLGGLDDVRQKVVEQGWTGEPQTQSHILDTQYSDFVAWLYGGGKTGPENVQDGLGRAEQNTTAAWVARGIDNQRSAGQDSAGGWPGGSNGREPPDRGDDQGLEI